MLEDMFIPSDAGPGTLGARGAAPDWRMGKQSTYGSRVLQRLRHHSVLIQNF